MAYWARRDGNWGATLKVAPSPGKAMLEAALAYRRMGWSVIPVGRNKRPLIAWKRFQLQLASEAQIRQWFTEYPDANVAVIFGAVSGNLACRDFDTLEAWATFETEHPGMARLLPVVRTSRGYHVYFTAETRTVRFADGEIRGEGAYCVTAPSIHADGRRYEWVREPSGQPATVNPAIFGKPVAPPPKPARKRQQRTTPTSADIESLPIRNRAAWNLVATMERMDKARDIGDVAEFDRLTPKLDHLGDYLQGEGYGETLRGILWPNGCSA